MIKVSHDVHKHAKQTAATAMKEKKYIYSYEVCVTQLFSPNNIFSDQKKGKKWKKKTINKCICYNIREKYAVLFYNAIDLKIDLRKWFPTSH